MQIQSAHYDLVTSWQGGMASRTLCQSFSADNAPPVLQNHPVLNKPNADNVAMAVLQGIWPEHDQGMLGFANELNDHQIAAVTKTK